MWRGQMALIAWAGLAGLSSTVAMRKMRDVLDALFKPNMKNDSKQDSKSSTAEPEGLSPSPATSPKPPEPSAVKPDVQTPTDAIAPKPVEPPLGGDS